MTFVDQITSLATAIADQFNSTVATINTTTGTLTNLTTTNQTSLVGAINEVKTDVSATPTITSANISDATTVGKAVLTAADGGGACTAIGTYTSAQIGDVTTNFAAAFTAALT